MWNLSQRAKQIKPFYVMDILAQAKALTAAGRDIIHLEVGEPDFDTPEPIKAAGIAAIQAGKTHYTPAIGLPELRAAIANWYQSYYSVTVSPERIVVTPGASGGLLLLVGTLLEQGQSVLLSEPGYPCNRHFARFVEAQSIVVPTGSEQGYQLTAEAIKQYWRADTALALVASPANPTGMLLDTTTSSSLSDAVKAQSGLLAVDEIYHGLSYDGVKAETVLSVDDDAIVINSFSKYFGMTGWRLGWLVLPEQMVATVDKLAQNLFLAPPTMAQYAALAVFEPETLTILNQRRDEFERRRDSLLPALRELGLTIENKPQGAFYLYANCEALLNGTCPDSMALTQYWLHEAGVAVTPGYDFGDHEAAVRVRFAYTQPVERLLEAVERITKLYR